jgi:Mn-dependent DtxR family transcriptional regulator
LGERRVVVLRVARERELLTLVRDAPGLTVSAAARTMGISSSQASNLARRLAEEGEIRRTDQGLVAVTEGDAELPAPG